jgi:hypothetical protein
MSSRNNFRIVGLQAGQFEEAFALDEAGRRAAGMQLVVADSTPGFPCRVSLVDAAVGEELLLLPFMHQPAGSPYRASGPIFVRRGATTPGMPPGFIPDCVSRRLMSVRAYDHGDCMVDATVCEGTALAPEIGRMLADDRVAYLHLHNAKRGCYSCRVERA